MAGTRKNTRRSSRRGQSSKSEQFSIDSVVPIQVLVPVLALFLLGISMLLFLFVMQRSADDRSQAAFFARFFQENQLSYGLVAHWSMDAEDTAVLASHGPTDLRSSGVVQSTDGSFGSAVQVRPGSHLETVGSIAIPSAEISVGGWFSTTLTGDTPLFSLQSENGDVFSVLIRRGGSSALIVRSSTSGEYLLPISSQDLSNWFYVAVSKGGDDSILRVRLNNTTSTTIRDETFIGGSYVLQVGRDLARGTSGTLVVDELSVWNRVLTENETGLLYNGGEGQEYPFPTIQPSF